MPLSPGTRLGSYEIVSPLGAGGMGEVYRARDTRLGRSVAIKVLPPDLAGDPERISRFEREARALAALNHPNVATLFGLESSDHGTHGLLLVMELVEGETLAERLLRGPLPVETALAFARQIAEGLEAAHENGIIHRDLKPANVKITPDEHVKVLDFGLARAMAVGAGGEGAYSDPASSPTLTVRGTQLGMILGTAAYMSPEQARGFAVDHRSDIFSFGLVLYEMLTGQRLFDGETPSDVLAGVIAREPDLSALPPGLNPRLPDLVQRCLAKSPRKRWQAIGDLRAEIEIIAQNPRAVPVAGAPAIASPVWKRALPAVALALVASALTGIVVWSNRPNAWPRPVTRFSVTLPGELRFIGMQRPMLAISPNGRLMAFSAGRPSGIYLRTMNRLDIRLISGSEDDVTSTGPAFSPDSQSIVYWTNSDQKLKRIPVTGGAAMTLWPTELPSGVTWTDDGIVFATTEGIYRINADGGRPEVLAKNVPGEIAFFPRLLPGGRAVLFTSVDAGGGSERWEAGRIMLLILATGERRVLIDGGTDARYVPSGHILFAQGGVVFAAPFDPAALKVTGRQVPVIEGVMRGSGTYGSGTVNMAISDEGTLAYLPGPLAPAGNRVSISLFDRTGGSQLLPIPAGPYHTPRLSPDGRHIAFIADDGRDVNVWVYDVGSNRAPRRLTFGGKNRSVAWSADSQRVAYRSDRDGPMSIYWQRADGSGTPERLTRPEKGAADSPLSFSPDGAWLLFDRTVLGRTTLWTYSLRDHRTARFSAVESSQLTGAVFSPDGKWVAYASRESARSDQVFVEPFPATGAKYQVSNSSEDAHHPVWSPDGSELFYTPGPGNRLIDVPVTFTPAVSFGTASTLNRPFANLAPSADRPYDVMRDGQHFLSTTDSLATNGMRTVTVVLNWFEELKTRAPAAK